MTDEGFEQWLLTLMSTHQWLFHIFIAQAAGFWISCIYIMKLRKQVRCLHFCFVGISDFGIDKLKELRDDYIADHGRDNTPFTLLDVEKEWAKTLAHYTDLQIRAGVAVPKDNHINYIMEGLR